MPVITMSRQVGSGSDEVAQRLCDDLGLVAFDKRLMVRVASEVGVSSQEIVDYSEAEYERRGFFDTLFRRNRPVAEFSMWIGSPDIGYERRARILDEQAAIDLIRGTIDAAYKRGNVLIIGRGGQAILEYRPDVLHVRVVAPYEDRLARLQDQQDLTAAQARRYLRENDLASAEYLRTFHHIDPDDSTLYHLVVNTGKLGIAGSVLMIEQALKLRPQEAPATDNSEA